MTVFRIAAILAVAGVAVLPASAEAQRSCKKGIPCGNSCISPTKTCRIGIGGEASKPDTASTKAAIILRALADYESRNAWVANVDGPVYYPISCRPAQMILPEEAVYFDTELDALKAGFRRSKAKGC